MVQEAQEYFDRPVAPPFATERALYNDIVLGKCIVARGDCTLAPLALNHIVGRFDSTLLSEVHTHNKISIENKRRRLPALISVIHSAFGSKSAISASNIEER
jgi:hypothetical protein